MESQKAESMVDLSALHEGAVDVSGLDDLFQWASELVAEGMDVRARKVRDQKVKRQVLNIIYKSAEQQAKAKVFDELCYLQRRVIALQSALGEKNDETCNLKQLVLAQYVNLQKIPELEEKLVQLESAGVDRENLKEEFEEERKQLMNALTKLKTERDLLDELLTANESENLRLVQLLKEIKEENSELKSRPWWHFLKTIWS